MNGLDLLHAVLLVGFWKVFATYIAEVGHGLGGAFGLVDHFLCRRGTVYIMHNGYEAGYADPISRAARETPGTGDHKLG